MKKLLFLFSTSFLLLSQQAMAATVEVTWQEPEKYVDIRSGLQNQTQYRKDVFFNIERHLKKLAEKLPEKQTLKMTITDVDLAGDVIIGGINQIRIVTEGYPSRFAFTYQLLDEKQQELLSGEENIRDMGFVLETNRPSNDAFEYDKKLLTRWFKKTILVD